jgi:hypothetical protein
MRKAKKKKMEKGMLQYNVRSKRKRAEYFEMEKFSELTNGRICIVVKLLKIASIEKFI